MPRTTHNVCVQGKRIVQVPTENIVKVEMQENIAPNMTHDARIIIDRPEVVAPGLRLGDWSLVAE